MDLGSSQNNGKPASALLLKIIETSTLVSAATGMPDVLFDMGTTNSLNVDIVIISVSVHAATKFQQAMAEELVLIQFKLN